MTENSYALDMVAVYRQTLDGQLLECNEACASMLGFSSSEELLATGRLNYLNASDPLTVLAALTDLGTLSNVEIALRRKDGTVVWALQNLKHVRVAGSLGQGR